MNEETIGTLCRLIPISTIDGKVVKYRVEHGDVGGVLGVVMNEVTPAGRPWAAYAHHEEEPYREARHSGWFASATAGALRLAVDRFAPGEVVSDG